MPMAVTAVSQLSSSKASSSHFRGCARLRGVSFDVFPGEVHALLGENGAGKSTLIKILSGVHSPDEGEVRVGGKVVHFTEPGQAQHAGIATIYQEFSLCPARTPGTTPGDGCAPRTLAFQRAFRKPSERCSREPSRSSRSERRSVEPRGEEIASAKPS